MLLLEPALAWDRTTQGCVAQVSRGGKLTYCRGEQLHSAPASGLSFALSRGEFLLGSVFFGLLLDRRCWIADIHSALCGRRRIPHLGGLATTDLTADGGGYLSYEAQAASE